MLDRQTGGRGVWERVAASDASRVEGPCGTKTEDQGRAGETRGGEKEAVRLPGEEHEPDGPGREADENKKGRRTRIQWRDWRWTAGNR